jgi:hypothetical protein
MAKKSSRIIIKREVESESLSRPVDDYFSQLDRWVDGGGEEESSPLKLLMEMGKTFPASAELSSAEVLDKLWELIDSLAFLGVFVEGTDHLNDQELYEKLVAELLIEPALMVPGDPNFAWHLDIIGGFSEADIEIYLRYYADEATRRHWKEEFPDHIIPESATPPFDRDRFLPRRGSVASSPSLS